MSPIRSLELVKFEVKKTLIAPPPLECDKQNVHTFQILAPSPNAFCRLFTRMTHDRSPVDSGNIPSGMPGYHSTIFPPHKTEPFLSVSLWIERLCISHLYTIAHLYITIRAAASSLSPGLTLFLLLFWRTMGTIPRPSEREMGLPALPWKPWPCSSNQHVGTGKLFHWLPEWTKNKTGLITRAIYVDSHYVSLSLSNPICQHVCAFLK